jgi:ribonuclease BN (tRNA processing enzyme)
MLDNEDFKKISKLDNGNNGIIHSDSLNVAHLARKAKVDNLVLSHCNPSYSETRLNNMEKEAKDIFKSSILLKDLGILNI